MGALTKVTSKGQVTIPKEVREWHDLEPGDTIEFIKTEAGYLIMPKKLRAIDLAGVLGPPPDGVSLEPEDLKKAIGDAVAEDDERIMREWSNSQAEKSS